METLLYFVVTIGILVFFHELGHFLFAKLFGVKVETFSIGFGPKLLKINRWNTEFAVSLVPFGGYVKMAGENPEDAVLEDDWFYAKKPWKRILIAFAGPLANLLLAFFLFVLVFYTGRYVPSYQVEEVRVGVVTGKDLPLSPGDVILSVDGERVKNWKDFSRYVALNPNKKIKLEVKRGDEVLTVSVPVRLDEVRGIGVIDFVPAIKPVIGKVIEGSPAEKAGLKEGDIILTINGKDITAWRQVVDAIRNSGGTAVTLEVLRGKERIELTVVPRFNEKLKRYTIGIVPRMEMVFVRFKGLSALKRALKEFKEQTETFFSFLERIVTGRLSLRSLGGPITIAEFAHEAGESGLSNFIYFVGFISLQLGYFNLLPLPVLDGGLILLFLIEILKGGMPSARFREVFQQIGFVLLAIIMGIVIYNDIMRMFR